MNSKCSISIMCCFWTAQTLYLWIIMSRFSVFPTQWQCLGEALRYVNTCPCAFGDLFTYVIRIVLIILFKYQFTVADIPENCTFKSFWPEKKSKKAHFIPSSSFTGRVLMNILSDSAHISTHQQIMLPALADWVNLTINSLKTMKLNHIRS